VAGFLGVCRDTLKYYEEKQLVNPKHDVTGYRKYNKYDIYDEITINFYRELDIKIKNNQEIRQSQSIEDLENVLVEKETQILEELEYKKRLLQKIKSVKEDCDNIKQYLGKFTIKEMKPIQVIGEITDYTAYDEYDIIRDHTTNLKKAVTLTSIRRVIHFDEDGITKDQFIVVSNVDDEDSEHKANGDIHTYPKCLYTVIADGRAINEGKN